MGISSGGQGDRGLPWIFIHDTDKVEKALMVLFFGLFLLTYWKFFCRRPC